jgi:nucleotide-binding universal stress UspA family protein
MKKIKKILCPVDFSELSDNAAKYAWQLADHYGADLLLLHVVYPDTQSLDLPTAALAATQLQLSSADEMMKALSTRLQATGGPSAAVEIMSMIEIGSAVALIQQLVVRESADIIVIGARGGGKSLNRLLGSNTLELIRVASCPVWVIPEGAIYHPVTVVLFAASLTKSTPFLLWELKQLLGDQGQIIRCVHVKQAGDADSELSFEELALFMTEKGASTLQLSFHEWEEGEIADTIYSAGSTYDADLIVMIRPHRGLIDRFLHRSSTQQLVEKSAIPLLVMPA